MSGSYGSMSSSYNSMSGSYGSMSGYDSMSGSYGSMSDTHGSMSGSYGSMSGYDGGSSAGPFIVQGPCPVTDDGLCVSSVNFGNGNYGNNERCDISGCSGYGRFIAFDTESGFDKVATAGVEYQGGFPQSDVPLGMPITWRSDGSVTKSGWKLCQQDASGSYPA